MSERLEARLARQTSLHRPLLVGALVGLGFFAGFGGWAATAPLAGATAAPALVAPEGARKRVQHREGGIVRQILVRDGSLVAAGDPLLRLDAEETHATHRALLAQEAALLAREARLVAEETGRATPRFVGRIAADPAFFELRARETALLARDRAALADARRLLDAQRAQEEARLAGHDAAIASASAQLGHLAEERAGIRALVEKGLERKPRLLALERAAAQLEGARAASRAERVLTEGRIAETAGRLAGLASARAAERAKERAAIRQELGPLGQELARVALRLERLVLRAPVAGRIVALQATTEGGVVLPGEVLMEIVPAGAELLLEARVQPIDIARVHAGLGAEIHLPALRDRGLGRVQGIVRTVSADRLTDARSGAGYYAVKVAVAPEALPAGLALTPGMPAEVLIGTGERTLLRYLLEPVLATLRHGLRER